MLSRMLRRRLLDVLVLWVVVAVPIQRSSAVDKPPEKPQLVQEALESLQMKLDPVKQSPDLGVQIVGGTINFNGTENLKPGEERTATAAIFKNEEEAVKAFSKVMEMAKTKAEKDKAKFETLKLGDADGFVTTDASLGGSDPMSGLIFVQGHFRCGEMLVETIYKWVTPIGPSPKDEAGLQAMRDKKARLAEEGRYTGTSWMHKVDQALVAKDCCTTGDISIALDRVKGARFSAIRVTGKGFRADRSAIITWNGVEVFRVERLAPDGSIPGTSDDRISTWIWVPDDAPLDRESEVVAVESESGRHSPAVKYAVVAVTKNQLIDNFDSVIERYLKEIPANPKSTTGWYWNLTSWLRSDGGVYTCGWYQGRVLEFFDRLRFSRNVQDRALLDGIDYAPCFSGLTRTVRIGLFGFTKPHYIDGSMPHTYVIAWPHGPALMPQYLAGAFPKPPTWENTGICFDPWHDQKPMLREIHSLLPSPTGFWAADSIYARRWLEKPVTYLAPTVEPRVVNSEGTKIDPPYRGLYPVTGARYYIDSTKRGVADKVIQFMKGESSTSFAVHCPVLVQVKDEQGRVAELGRTGRSRTAFLAAPWLSIS